MISHASLFEESYLQYSKLSNIGTTIDVQHWPIRLFRFLHF